MPDSCYFVHGTDLPRFFAIVRSWRLNPDAKPRMLIDPAHAKGKKRVFMQLLSEMTVPKRCTAVFWGRCTLVFSSDILPAQQGTFGYIGSSGKGSRRYTAKTLDLPAFQREIHDRIDHTQKNRYRQCSVNGYMHSHEITMEKPVSLDHLRMVLADTEALKLVIPFLKAHKRTSVSPASGAVKFLDITKITYLGILKALR